MGVAAVGLRRHEDSGRERKRPLLPDAATTPQQRRRLGSSVAASSPLHQSLALPPEYPLAVPSHDRRTAGSMTPDLKDAAPPNDANPQEDWFVESALAETTAVPDDPNSLTAITAEHPIRNECSTIAAEKPLECQGSKDASNSCTSVPDSTNEMDWVAAAGIPRCDSDSDTDDEELRRWAVQMLGVPPPQIVRRKTNGPVEGSSSRGNVSDVACQWGAEDFHPIPMSISEKVKLARRNRSTTVSFAPISSPPRKPSIKLSKLPIPVAMAVAPSEAPRKVSTRPLTAAEIRSILGPDAAADQAASGAWVRRSVRQPSQSHLTAPRVKQLLEKLRANDSDMVILKMKKYCSDLDTPSLVMDAVLEALEENSNCEALYIQNFNEGMRDEQVLHLLRILQRPSCKIWCLNIGETYKVQMKTWEKFTKGLVDTNITHMYASEHTITAELKEQIRETIRRNRQKHHWHDDPANIDTIVQCTHCWWNPINAKSLRPYVQRKGYDHILRDAETQGLPGSMTGAFLS